MSSEERPSRLAGMSKTTLATLVAGVGVVGAIALTQGPEEAQQVAEVIQEPEQLYGLVSGFLDGLTMPLNMILEAYGEPSTLAADGEGLLSTPHNGINYAVGALFGAYTAGAAITGLVSEVVSSFRQK